MRERTFFRTVIIPGLVLVLSGTSMITPGSDAAAEDIDTYDSKLQHQYEAIADSLPQFGKGALFYRKTIEQWNTEAIAALDREDLNTAAIILQRALWQQRDPCLYYNLCLTMLRKSDLDSAVEIMNKALQYYPDDYDLQQLRAYLSGLRTSVIPGEVVPEADMKELHQLPKSHVRGSPAKQTHKTPDLSDGKQTNLDQKVTSAKPSECTAKKTLSRRKSVKCADIRTIHAIQQHQRTR
jgi:tetratricopeptide (TPR) repeat protein